MSFHPAPKSPTAQCGLMRNHYSAVRTIQKDGQVLPSCCHPMPEFPELNPYGNAERNRVLQAVRIPEPGPFRAHEVNPGQYTSQSSWHSLTAEEIIEKLESRKLCSNFPNNAYQVKYICGTNFEALFQELVQSPVLGNRSMYVTAFRGLLNSFTIP